MISTLTRLSKAHGITHELKHLLQSCVDFEYLKRIHARVIQCGLQQDVHLVHKLLTVCTATKKMEYARLIFDLTNHPDQHLWASMIHGYTRNGLPREAFLLFNYMEKQGCLPNPYVLSCLLKACWVVSQCAQLHSRIVKSGYSKNSFIRTTFVDVYCRFGDIDPARQVFDEMSERNVVTYTALISGYSILGDMESAELLFSRMPEKNVISWTAMLSGHVQCGDVKSARLVFNQMPEKNVVSWTAMISGLSQNGFHNDAIKVFREMQHEDVKPNQMTLVSVLCACSHLGALSIGRWAHDYMRKQGIHQDSFLATALVDMYMKCGCVANAREVFRSSAGSNVSLWNAMIVGLAANGCAGDALAHFSRMDLEKIKPNDVTFIGVLSACSHVGLVEEGLQFFQRMTADYDVTPSLEHYACIVDMYGRRGSLKEAEDFIHNMPMKPDIVVWSALLSACRKFKNLQIGKRALEYIVEQDPRSSACLLLAEIYAAKGLWTEAAKVRNRIGTSKLPGCSVIEVDNMVHEFFAGEKSHPELVRIHEKLKELVSQLVMHDYVLYTPSVLYNLEEEEKEHVLHTHSEKLALAFGLLKTSKNTSIRIVKNLRICEDCHNFVKLTSKITNRIIVIRDRIRFHHFSQGSCSCNDYW